MNLLAVDTACSILSVAAERTDGHVHYAQIDAGTRHSELIMSCIDSLMKEASLSPGDLDGVLCMEGPGSFTGLRIGYSIAKGLALSLSIPFAAVPTLDCIAYPFRDRSDLILAAIEAGKTAFYYAFYRGGRQLKPPADGDEKQINAEIESFLPEKVIYAYEKRGYARELLAIGKTLDFNNSALLYKGPEYYRKSDAEQVAGSR